MICERGEDGQDFLPVFMKGRIYVDISSDEKYGEGMDELLRLIFEQPLYPEPSLGEVPAFLAANGSGLPMARELSGALRAIRDGKRSREGLERLLLKSVVAETERLEPALVLEPAHRLLERRSGDFADRDLLIKGPGVVRLHPINR